VSRILLDTNAYTHLLAGDTHVLEEVAGAEQVNMSVFVLGELLAGFRGGSKFEQNGRTLREFMAKSTVVFLAASEETAEVFGQLKDTLRKQGTPIPINDAWIAAQAIQTGSVLVTYDEHFSHIPGLRLWVR